MEFETALDSVSVTLCYCIECLDDRVCASLRGCGLSKENTRLSISALVSIVLIFGVCNVEEGVG